jgi:hypothetical protein
MLSGRLSLERIERPLHALDGFCQRFTVRVQLRKLGGLFWLLQLLKDGMDRLKISLPLQFKRAIADLFLDLLELRLARLDLLADNLELLKLAQLNRNRRKRHF